MKKSACRLLAFLLLITGGNTARLGAATTINVNTTSDGFVSGKTSLRSAVTNANNAASLPVIINVPAGTYALTLGELTLGPGVGSGAANKILIVGTNAPLTVITQSDGSSRIFDFDTNGDGNATLALADLTLTGGNDTKASSPFGAGAGGGAVLTGDAGSGGDALNLTNCVFLNNKATGPGAAIQSTGGKVGMVGCLFTNNSSGLSGGAVYFQAFDGGDSLTATTCVFVNNSVSSGVNLSQGGGLAADTDNVFFPTLILTNCAFGGNTVTSTDSSGEAGDGGGGAIWTSVETAASIIGCTFTNNQANGTVKYGGAINLGPNSTNLVEYCRFLGNSVASGGAGPQIYIDSGRSEVATHLTANDNWWASDNGPASGAIDPGAAGVPTGIAPVISDANWLFLTNSASPASVAVAGTSTVTASFLKDSAGTTVAAANLMALTNLAVVFSGVDGTNFPAQTVLQTSGTAATTFTGTNAGTGGATATVDGVSSTASITVTAASVTVTSVSSSPASAAYKASQTVPITVTFSGVVTVTGTPLLALSDSGSASYASGSGTAALTFNYTVGGSDTSAHLDYAATTSLTLNSGTIKSGGTAATLTLPTPGAAGSLSANTSIIIDTTNPSVSITAEPLSQSPTNAPSFSFTDSDSGSGVASVQYQLDGGSLTGATSPLQLSGLADGAHTFSLVVTDNAGNAATNSYTWTVDTTPPNVTISAPSVLITAKGPINYTVTWTDANLNLASISLTAVEVFNNEIKTGSALVTGLTVSNGVSNFRPVQLTTLSGDGTIAFKVPAGTAKDFASNSAGASAASMSVIVDNTKPAVTISAPSVSITNSSGMVTYNVGYSDVNFSHATLTGAGITLNHTGTASGAVTVTPGTGTATTTNYTVTVSSLMGDGALGVTVAAGTSVDLAGNTNAVSAASATFTVDDTAPVVTVSAPSTTLTNGGGTVSYTVSYFDANFEGASLAAGNITLTNGAVTGAITVTANNSTNFTVSISNLAGSGAQAIQIAAGTATDLAGHSAPAAGPSASFSVDTTAPTVTISAPSVASTNAGGAVSYTVSYFDANFAGASLAAGNITLTNGAVTGTITVTTNNSTNFTVSISNLAGVGAQAIQIAAGTATDLAGNSAPAAGPSASFTLAPSSGPSITIGGPSPSATVHGPVTFTVTYADPSFSHATLVAGSISLNTAGTAAGAVTSVVGGAGGSTGTNYTVTISNVSGSGSIAISIAAGTASDTLGALSAAAGPSPAVVVDLWPLLSLYSFTNGVDGADPAGVTLVRGADGRLYGTTSQGGSNGVGTVFGITTAGVFSALYSFTDGLDGADPDGGVIQGRDGNLYGTASAGGTQRQGAMFEITTNGALTPLYSFTNGFDGADPAGALLQGADGAFYGLAKGGGANSDGTVFQVTTNGGFTTLYPFEDGNDGATPYGGLIQGRDGNLYGTANGGGICEQGTIFLVTTNGAFVSLYVFTGLADGANPYGSLLLGEDGALYGTAFYGGNGYGTVFRFTTNGAFTTLYAFTNGVDGANPKAGVVQGSDGYLYGTAYNGGGSQAGTVYRVSTNGAFALVYSFTNGVDGAQPSGALLQTPDGNLYGTTEGGGAWTNGVVFELVNPNPTLSSILVNGGNNDGTVGTSGVSLTNLWTFTANVGDNVVLRLGTTNFTANLNVYGPDGALLSAGAGNDDPFTFSATNSGTFNVQVSSYFSGGSGAYVLRLAQFAQPFAVPAVVLTNGGDNDGTLVLGGLDRWSFTANAGDNVVLRLGTTNFSANLSVYGPDGALLSSGGGDDDPFTFTATNSGAFTALVNDFNAGDTGAYVLRLAQFAQSFSVPAVALTNGGVNDGTLVLAGLDRWSFTAQVGDNVVLRLETTNFSANLSVYGPDGALLSSGGGDDDPFTFTATNSGTFTALVDDYNAGDTGAYVLRLAQFGQPFSAQAVTLTNGGDNPGTLVLGGLDRWTFTANVGDNVVLRLGTTNFSANLNVYGPDGALLSSGGGDDDPFTFTATNSGAFTALVSDYNAGDTGPYVLRLAQFGQPFAVPAVALTNGGENDGTLVLAGLDRWSFTAHAGDNVMLRLDTTNFTGNLSVYGPDGALLFSGGGDDVPYSFTATNSGAFTALVNDFNAGDTGAYVLRLANFSQPFAVPAVTLTNGGGNNATLSLGALDRWTFTGNAGDNVVLRLGTTNFSATLDVYGPDGELLGSGSGDDVPFTFTPTNSGAFMVLVSDYNAGDTGAYVLRLAEFAQPFTVPAISLTNNVNNGGTLVLAGLDRWTFQAYLGDNVALRLDTTNFNAALSLYGPDGALLGSGSGNDVPLSFIPTNSGAFTALVDSQDPGGTGAYALSLSDTDTNLPSITISGPSAAGTVSGPVTYTVTYADADFSHSTLSEANISFNAVGTAMGGVGSVVGGTGSATGTNYLVTITNIAGSGSLSISVAPGTAVDLAGNLAPAAGPSAAFAVDLWNLVPLYSFTNGVDGANPEAALLQAADRSLYGTTDDGGSNGFSTVFRITTNGMFGALYSFTNGTHGFNPVAGLLQSSDGNLYGTAGGGTNQYGTVFRITTNGVFSVLYAFTNGVDGANPEGGLLQAPDGSLYGTAAYGGANGYGTVFRITTNGVFAPLYSFTNGVDGALPRAGLIHGADGSLYGTAYAGGTNGDGAVFQVTTNGVFAALYSFTGGADGEYPKAGLAQAEDGNLYGTAAYGGASGYGSVYRMTTNGVFAALYSFTNGVDGASPSAGLLQAGDGDLYGTASQGGTGGAGTVYRMTTGGVFAVLYQFTNGVDGKAPDAGLVQALDGNLYGTAEFGGTNGYGAVFRLVNPFSITVTGPSVALTNGGSVTYTVTYSDPGFSHATLTIPNITVNATGSATGTVSSVVGGAGSSTGTNYTVTLSNLAGNGTLGISIAAGTAVDLAGNLAPRSGASPTFTVDTNAPVITISGPSTTLTNAGGVVRYTVSYFDTNFVGASLVAGNITLTNAGVTGSISVITNNATNYTVVLSGLAGGGAQAIQIAAGTAIDLAGNSAPSAGPSGDFTVDTNAPVLTISGPSTTLTNAGGVVGYTVSYFDTNFVGASLVAGDISLTDAAVTGSISVVTNNATNYTVVISGLAGSGAQAIQIAAGTATDSAGNSAPSAGPSGSFTVDTNAPAITISGPSTTLTNAGGSVRYTVSYFDTNFVGANLVAGDISLTNAAVTGSISVVTNNATNYTVVISSLAGSGAQAIRITSGTAADLAGNSASAAGPSGSFTVDTNAPVITISGPSTTLTNAGGVVRYTVSYFDTNFVGASLVAGNITLTNAGVTGSISVITNNATNYTVVLSGLAGGGAQAIQIAAGTAIDLAGNSAPSAGPSGDFTVDTNAPVLTISGPSTTLTNAGGSVRYTVSYFDTNFVGATLVAGNITLTNAGVTGSISVVTNNATNYTVVISSLAGSGAQAIRIAAGTATDLAGNGAPSAGPSGNFTVDTNAPVLTISGPSTTLTNAGGSVRYTVSYFDTNFIGATLVAGNITLTNAGVTGSISVVTNNATNYTVVISGLAGGGAQAIRIASGTATDLAGNSAPSAGPSGNFTVDTNAPVLTISGPSVTITNGGSVSYTVNIVDAVLAGSSLPALSVQTNQTGTATLTSITVTPGAGTATTTNYLVTLSGLAGNGTLGITIPPGTAFDEAGNKNAAQSSGTFTVDTTPPTVTISAPTASSTGEGSSVAYTISYFDLNFGRVALTAGNITLTNPGVTGTITVTTNNATNFAVVISSLAGIGAQAIQIAAGTAVDLADNSAPAAGPAGSFSVTAPLNFALYVGNNGNNTVSVVSSNGVVSTFVPSTAGLNNPKGLAFDSLGNLYVANFGNNTVSKVTPGGVVSTFVNAGAGLNGPSGLAFDTAGNLYVANRSSWTISKVTPGGVVSTFVNAADGVFSPDGLAFDSTDNLYIGDASGTVLEVTPGGLVSTFLPGTAGSGIAALTFDSAGNLYVGDVPDETVSKVTPGGVVTSVFSPLNGLWGPQGLAVDSAGNLYIASNTNVFDGVLQVTPGGTVLTFVSNSAGLSSPVGLAIGPARATQLQILLPGETAAPGTSTGKTGALLLQTAGGSFQVTINAVDPSWNVIPNATPTLAFSSSDGAATLPASAALVNGSGSFTLSLNTAGGQTITAIDTAASLPLRSGTSSTVAVVPVTVASVSSSPSQGFYKAGETAPITIAFSDNVTVTGFPLLQLNDGGVASYLDGSGTTTLTFDYTVGSGDTSGHLDYASATALSLNGGTIDHGTAAVVLTLPSPESAGSLGANTALVIDTTPPSVAISTPSVSITNGGSVSYTVTFSDANLAGSSVSALSVLTNETGSATVSTITVTPGAGTATTTNYLVTLSGLAGDGTLGITIPAGSAFDAAGNNSAAQSSGTFTVDTNLPAVAISGPSVTITNSGSVSYTVTFTDLYLEGSTLPGLSVLTNVTGTASLTNLSVTPGTGTATTTNYTVTLSGVTGNGTLGITIPAGVAFDEAGNKSPVAVSATFTVDTNLPAVAISGPSVTITNSGSVSYTVTFTDVYLEGSTLPALNVLTNVTGTASLTNLSVTPGAGTATTTNYTVTLSGVTGNGTLGITIPSGVAFDEAGNKSPAAASATFTVDTNLPAVAISGPSAAITNSGSVSYTVTFTDVYLEGSTLPALSVLTNVTGTASLTNLSVTPGAGTATTTNYTVTLAGVTGNGTLGITIPSGVAFDEAGNKSPAAASATFTVDTNLPAVAISGPSAAITNSGSVSYTVTFTDVYLEGSTLPALSVLTNVTGTASLTNLSVTPGAGTATTTNYTVTLSGVSGNGTLGIAIPSGVAFDEAGNKSPAAVSATFIVDTNLPAVAISGPSVTITNSGSVSYTVTFTDMYLEGSTLPSLSVLTNVTGTASLTNLSVTPGAGTVTTTNYTVTLSGVSGNGTLGITIPAGVAFDEAGNKSPVAVSATFIVDTNLPGVAISGPSVTITNSGSVSYTVTFTDTYLEGSTLPALSVLTNVTGTASLTNLSVTPGTGTATTTNYTVTLAGLSGNGTLGITIPAGVAFDEAGNKSPAAVSASFTVDTNLPLVAISGPSVVITNSGSVSYTVTFTDTYLEGSTLPALSVLTNVTGTASLTNLSVTPGTGTATTTNYTVTLAGLSGNGTLGITIPAGVAFDEAGNKSPAAVSASFTVDTNLPLVAISGPSVAITNSGSVSYTVTFTDMYLDGSTLPALSVLTNQNGTASLTNIAVTPGTGTGTATNYLVTLSGLAGNGNLGIIIPAGAAFDAAGNKSAAVAGVTFQMDTIPPLVTISAPSVEITNGGSVSYSVTFGDSNFAASILSALSVLTNQTGSATITNISVTPGAGEATLTNYLVTLSGLAGNGTLGITVPAGAALDTAGNRSAAQSSVTFEVDTTLPSVTISAPSESITNGGSVSYTVTLADADLAGTSLPALSILTNQTGSATITNIAVTPGSGTATTTNYQVTLSGLSGNGTLGITIPAGAAFDEAGNKSPAQASGTFEVDTTLPSVTISAPSESITNGGSVSYTVTFADADLAGTFLSASSVGLIQTGTATITNIAVTPGTGTATSTNYLVRLCGVAGNGTLGITVPAGSAWDTAGNQSALTVSGSFTVDTNLPTVTFSAPSAAITNGGCVSYTVTFSDADLAGTLLPASGIVAFSTGSATVTNVTVKPGAGTVTSTNYLVTVSGLAGNGTLAIVIPAGSAWDTAGNQSALAVSGSFTLDTVLPTVAISGPSVSITNGRSVSYTVSFADADLAGTSLPASIIGLIENGTATSTNIVVTPGTGTATSTNYLVTVSGLAGNGTLAVSIPAGTAFDTAGNQSAPLAGASFTLDTTAPAVTISAPSVSITNGGSVSYTVSFADTDLAGTSLTASSAGAIQTGSASYTNIVVVPGTGTATTTNYTVRLCGLAGNGTLAITIPTGSAFDTAGNQSAATASASFTVDTMAPTVTISAPSAALTNGGSVSFTVSFADTDLAGTSLPASSIITVQSGTATFASLLVAPGAGTATTTNYTVIFFGLSGNGTIGIAIPAGAASDVAGNQSASASSATFTIVTTPPLVTISGPSSSVTNGGSVSYTVTYASAYFNSAALSAANITLNITGTAAGTVSGVSGGAGSATGTNYLVTVSALSGNGTVGISLAAGTASDLAGNPAPAAGPSATVTVDTTPPTVTITGPSASFTNGGSVTYVVSYFDANLAQATLAAGNISLPATGTATGTVSSVTGGSGSATGTNYTVTVSGLAGNGTLGFSLGAGTAVDLAGNVAGAASAPALLTVDTIPPTVTISGPSTPKTANGPVTYTVSYADANFGSSSLAASNIVLNATGTAAGSVLVSGGGTAYTVTVEGITGSGSLGISLPPGTAVDLAGNPAPGAGPSAGVAVTGWGAGPLYSFTNGMDGAIPQSGVIQGRDGVLYGVAEDGTNQTGVFYSITTNGVFAPIYTFSAAGPGGTNADGINPDGSLVQGLDGTFYGTTYQGGASATGTVFRVTTGGALTSLYSFTGGADGSRPVAGLIQTSDGNLHGVTAGGGTNGSGGVFQITTNGVITPVYSFSALDSNGFNPDGFAAQSPLVLAGDGNLYGTAPSGGTNGAGTVFRLTSNGVFSVVYTFSGGADGATPVGSLTAASDGNLYGTTLSGGSFGQGTIFRITTGGALASLYSFAGALDGANPFAGMLQASDGGLYGTTRQGGPVNAGTVFRLGLDGSFSSIYAFTAPGDSANPQGSLAQGSNGSLYGTSVAGGTAGAGSVFELFTPATTPVITSQPVSQSGTPGGTANFAVGVVGAAPLTYQWFFNGTNLPGATNSILSVPGLDGTQAGLYTVVVSNVAGSVTSSPAQLFYFGLTIAANQFVLTIGNVPGTSFQIDVSDDLSNPNGWTTLTNITLTTSPISFTDVEALVQKRFYRVVPLP